MIFVPIYLLAQCCWHELWMIFFSSQNIFWDEMAVFWDENFRPKRPQFRPVKIFGTRKIRPKVVPISLCQKVFWDENHHFIPKNFFWDEIEGNRSNTFERKKIFVTV